MSSFNALLPCIDNQGYRLIFAISSVAPSLDRVSFYLQSILLNTLYLPMASAPLAVPLLVCGFMSTKHQSALIVLPSSLSINKQFYTLLEIFS